ncbi:Wadjet anti-phage system protein JetA family protein, partial [Candidatus Phytoplasma pini]
MSRLFKVIPPYFFHLLTSSNKDIYVDCLLILENLINEENNLNIDKKIALNYLEKYFYQISEKILLKKEDEETLLENPKQKATKIISIFKKNGWLCEERVDYHTINLNLFDYSLEMIHFIKKILNQIKPESVGNIYSIYSLLKTFLNEKNYATFQEIHSKSEGLVMKLKILKANVYRFYDHLLNMQYHDNVQQVLEQLLLDYKKNFFDSSYYLLKTTDNFFKYRRKINSFLIEIKKNNLYFQFLSEKQQKIDNISDKEAKKKIFFLIETIQKNLSLTDQLIEIIDIKNEEYLKIACERILFFDNQKQNTKNLLNLLIKEILNDNHEYHRFFNFVEIKNLDEFSFYKPRRIKQKILINDLEIIPETTKQFFQKKKLS